MSWLLPPVPPEMYPGPIRELVELFAPNTEASPQAIAAQFIVAFGNAVGAGPHFYVGETVHHLNENLALVGPSGRSRKGDSKEAALRILREADPDWGRNITGGLSSGEGLIYAVRDPVEKVSTAVKKKGELIVSDPGIEDKRLLVVETEFSGPLKQMSRDGNTLSNTIRDAWDHKSPLRTLTRNSPLRATGAHISIIAHTTPEDLNAYLAEVEAANGLANRFMFFQTARSGLLPNPGRVPEYRIRELTEKVTEALTFGRRAGEMRRTLAAEAAWERVYPALSEDIPGLVGKLLARSEAHVTRLSALFALICLKREIDVDHLRSALAFWKYAEASTRNIFANRTGNDAADRIKQDLLPGQAMTVTEIREEIFSGHISASRIQSALQLLLSLKEITVDREETGGRPRVIVTRLQDENTSSLSPKEISEKSEKSPSCEMAA